MCLVAQLAPYLQANEPTPETLEEVEARILSILEVNNTPGFIGAIVIGDDMVWTGTLGIADRDTQRSVVDSTPFRVGSISKTITSLAALVLHERNVLSLDTILHSVIPEVGIENRWRATDPIRLVHVLEHTAGFDDIHLREYAASDPDIQLLDGIQFNTTSRVARWRPGRHMSYSNIGPAIAGYAIEMVTAEPYKEFVDREILTPIGMNDASFEFDPRVAASYRANGVTAEPYMHILGPPSGALSATAADMAALLTLFVNRGTANGQQLISESSLSRMERSETTLASSRELVGGYGLGNFSTEVDGFVYQGHDGGVDGFLSRYGYLPSHNRGYFFSINAANRQTYQAIDEVLRAFLTLGLDAVKPEPQIDAELSHLIGYYEPLTVRNERMRFLTPLFQTLRADLRDGTFVLTPFFEQPSVWIPVRDGRYRYGDLTQANLAEVAVPESTTPLLSGQPGTLHRVPAYVAWLRWVGLIFCLTLMASALVFAMIWVPRFCFGRLRNTESLAARAWPAATTACFAACVLLAVSGSADALRRLGVLSLYSGGYWALSWLFATMCLVSVGHAWRHATERSSIGAGVWWHAQLVTTANVTALGYLSYFGMIGLRFWAD